MSQNVNPSLLSAFWHIDLYILDLVFFWHSLNLVPSCGLKLSPNYSTYTSYTSDFKWFNAQQLVLNEPIILNPFDYHKVSPYLLLLWLTWACRYRNQVYKIVYFQTVHANGQVMGEILLRRLTNRVWFWLFWSYFRWVLHDVLISKVSPDRHQSSWGFGLLQKYRGRFITILKCFIFVRGFALNGSIWTRVIISTKL